jgi:hypothetical protein
MHEIEEAVLGGILLRGIVQFHQDIKDFLLLTQWQKWDIILVGVEIDQCAPKEKAAQRRLISSLTL